MLLIVAYDLHPSPARDYSVIEDAVRSCGASAHLQGSVWVVDTMLTPRAVTDKLTAASHPRDSFFVAQLHQNWWSRGLTETLVDWLKGTPRRW